MQDIKDIEVVNEIDLSELEKLKEARKKMSIVGNGMSRAASSITNLRNALSAFGQSVKKDMLYREERIAEYQRFSKELKVKIRDNNGLQLALMGADQEVINSGLDYKVYEIMIKQG